jgi:hypothetical protein
MESVEEGLELAVNATGHVQVITAAQATPAASLIAPAVATWRFRPACESGAAVASRVLVAAICRAPALYNAASSVPVNLVDRSSQIPFPTVVGLPACPPRAVADALAIGEVPSARVLDDPAPGIQCTVDGNEVPSGLA